MWWKIQSKIMSVVVDSLYEVCLNNCDMSVLTTLESPWIFGPIAQLLPPIVPIATVFVYRNTHSEGDIVSLPRLYDALQNVLRYYPHLTGRIEQESDSQTLRLTNFGERGIGVYSATCSTSLSAFYCSDSISGKERLIITDLPDGGNALLPPFTPTVEAMSVSPILNIQHTRYACGSVSLGIQIPHYLCDSEGYFQLVHDIVTLYHSDTNKGTQAQSLLPPPHIHSAFKPDDPAFAHTSTPPTYEPMMFELHKDLPIGESFISSTTTFQSDPAGESLFPSIPPSRVIGKVLRFSAQELQRIKLAATPPPTPPPSLSATTTDINNEWVSTFEALCAHLYQRLYQARRRLAIKRGLSIDTLSTDILTPVNWRGSNRLQLPSRYFPNAVLTTTMSLPAETLHSGTLSEVAGHFHNRLRILTPLDVKSTLLWINTQHDKSKIIPRFQLSNGGFMISQWSKFDMYRKLAFDGIDPVLVAPPFTPISLIDGLGYLLATEDQLVCDNVSDCAIDLNIALDEFVWEELDNDSSFRI